MSKKYNWVLKQCRSEPHPYLLIRMEDDGRFCAYGHERYARKETAIARAKVMCSQGQRVDVVKDVAASENWV